MYRNYSTYGRGKIRFTTPISVKAQKKGNVRFWLLCLISVMTDSFFQLEFYIEFKQFLDMILVYTHDAIASV